MLGYSPPLTIALKNELRHKSKPLKQAAAILLLDHQSRISSIAIRFIKWRESWDNPYRPWNEALCAMSLFYTRWEAQQIEDYLSLLLPLLCGSQPGFSAPYKAAMQTPLFATAAAGHNRVDWGHTDSTLSSRWPVNPSHRCREAGGGGGELRGRGHLAGAG